MDKRDKSFKILTDDIIACRLCPRLVDYRKNAPARPPFNPASYWRKPIPGFGDLNAWLLILGLAPSPQGGNRTGRIFTGDKSGEFLMKALFKQGFANQPHSLTQEDGLILKGCYITASVKCVPPSHRPTKQEFLNCNLYLEREIALLHHIKSVLVLGQGALEGLMLYAKKKGLVDRPPKFQHGKIYQLTGMPNVFASYHPSPQNTNTGKLTERMFNELLENIKIFQKKSAL